jgi:peptidoglycan/xylan/chitin deacetylase (PgdA/CDA1 family)
MKHMIYALIALAGWMGLGSQVGCSKREIRTDIAKFQDGKAAAVSLTYDDGSANQFRIAVPLMESSGFPATFHIITGEISGSRYTGRFIGRSTEAIVRETARLPTSSANFFERASAIGHLGLKGAREYHTRAGELFEEGDTDAAFRLIDEAYLKVRRGDFKPEKSVQEPGENGVLTWDGLKMLADRGFEISSHTITHPRLAVLDEANLVYELEKSQEDILSHLGPKHTFTIECPYGTEDARVIREALARYPASRNRLPEPFLEELNRWNDKAPGASNKEYVQWQRGVLTATPLGSMKSWVDTVVRHDNIWLVLVFHGIDSVGWEPKTGAELKEYFGYIKSLEERIWVATFQDVTKYIRERMHSRVTASTRGRIIEVDLRHDLPEDLYDLPLTLKTYVPAGWQSVEVKQGDLASRAAAARDERGRFVLYQAVPNFGLVTLAQPENRKERR